MWYVIGIFLILQSNLSYSLAYLHILTPGESYSFEPSNDYNSDFHIYCYRGKPKNIVYFFQSVYLKINNSDNNFKYYEGPDPESVETDYRKKLFSWSMNLFSLHRNQFTMNSFKLKCVGILSDKSYEIVLYIIRVDYWKFYLFLSGILLFLLSKRLSQNAVFYYLMGILIGISASSLILIYFLGKLFPKKPVMFSVVAGGWTLGLYAIKLLLNNLKTVIVNFQEYVIIYLVTTGFISFILCYRWGPLENQRTKDIINWLLKFIGLICMYFSTEYQEAVILILILLILINNIPRNWFSKPKRYWKKKFPKKVCLLTQEQYYNQGITETEKALEELRVYCSSPQSKPWKTILKLSDAKKFASFVEGDSHISEDEKREYESMISSTFTDDGFIFSEFED